MFFNDNFSSMLVMKIILILLIVNFVIKVILLQKYIKAAKLPPQKWALTQTDNDPCFCELYSDEFHYTILILREYDKSKRKRKWALL